MTTRQPRSAKAALALLVGLLVGAFLGGGAIWVLNRSKLRDASTVADVNLAKAPELELVPADASWLVHARLADMWRTEAWSEFRKVLEKAGPDAIKIFDEGFTPAPSTIDRITVFGPKSDQPTASGMCGIVAFSAPFEETKVREANFPQAVSDKSGGKTMWVDARSRFAVHFHSERTIVLGSPEALREYLAKPVAKDGPLASTLALAAGGQRHIVAAGTTNLATGQLPNDLPFDVRPLLKAESVAIGVVMGGGVKFDVRAAYKDAASAEEAEKSLRAAAAEARKKLVDARKKMETSVKGDPDAKKPRSIQELPEAAGSLFGLGALNSLDEWLAEPPLTREGNEIAATFTVGSIGNAYMGMAAASVGLLLPAVQKVREAAGRAADSNNLKQMGRLPEPEWGVKPGDFKFKGKLSWRVAILPYIEHDNLYRQFKLDEPWDSEHNKKLIPLMPKTYQSPLMPTEIGKTYYKTFVGGGAMFGRPNRFTIANIPDGSSNTIMVAEGGEPVIWTKPEDFEFDPKKLLPRIAAPGRNGFNALMGDGSVRFVPLTTPETTLKLLIQADDGMPIPNW
jgi:hypothetical protein